MRPKLLSLVAVAALLCAYTPAQATPGNHFMCYQTKDAKKVCWGTAGAPTACAVTDKVAGTCYGGVDDGNLCADPSECDTLVCQTSDCAGGTGPCYVGLPKGIAKQLADQFEDKSFDIKKPTEICAPASKNDEDPTAPSDPEHLMAFQVKITKGEAKHVKTKILVEDQFGIQAVETIKENRLFVPASKALNGPAGAPPTNLDHYKCYKAKPLKKVCVGGGNQFNKCKDDTECPGGFCSLGFAKLQDKNGEAVEVDDQFQTDRLYDVIKLKQVCAPVDKDGEGIMDMNLHYTCYLAKPSKPQPKFGGVEGVRINDQIGNQVVNVAKERELCLPAVKNPTVTTTTTTTTVGATTTTTGGGGCNDDCVGATTLSFTTSVGSGTCGTLASFRCSNPVGGVNQACVVNSDCNFGACVPSGTPFCADNFFVKCPGGAGDCVGTCNEVVSGNLPLDLECGGLYTGGGGNSVPLPFPVPDMGTSVTNVTGYNSGTGVLTLGPTTPGDTGSDRTCTSGRECSGNGAHCTLDADCPASQTCDTVCLFGPPLPIPNPGTPPTSVCTVNDVDFDASGSALCDTSAGDATVSTPLRSNVYLTGDLFQMTTPPDLPGVQPCPLCDTFCVGGTNDEFPCDDDSDCDSGDCNSGNLLQARCLGGPNDGMNCTPGTSDSATLGDTEGAYPTSHDCPPEPSTTITANIGGLPIDFALTSGAIVVQGVDLSETTGGKRVFSGFCRDNNGQSTQCFEGDTDGGCPTAIPAADGNAVPCTTDADCQADTDEYESCAQRNPGAFSNPGGTRITLAGSTDNGCLGDGLPHTEDLVSVFPIPPTFDSTVDAAGDLPGPGAAAIRGEALLQ